MKIIFSVFIFIFQLYALIESVYERVKVRQFTLYEHKYHKCQVDIFLIVVTRLWASSDLIIMINQKCTSIKIWIKTKCWLQMEIFMILVAVTLAFISTDTENFSFRIFKKVHENVPILFWHGKMIPFIPFRVYHTNFPILSNESLRKIDARKFPSVVLVVSRETIKIFLKSQSACWLMDTQLRGFYE